MLKYVKICTIILLVLLVASSAFGVLRTIDSKTLSLSDDTVNIEDSVTVNGEATGSGLTAIRIAHREEGANLWQVAESKDCSGSSCSIETEFSRDSAGTEEFQIKVEAGKLSESSLVKTVEFEKTQSSENEPPSIELEEPDDGDTISLPYTFEWSVDDPENDDIDANTLVIEEDGDVIEEEHVGDDEEFEADEDYLETGDYTWYVVSEDVEGNTGTSDSQSFTVEEEDEEASLEVRVEDNDGQNGKEMEDARVELSDGVDEGPEYTDDDGEVTFDNLPVNTDIDIEVKCYGETENEYNVELDPGSNSIEINFEESFESSVCGEEDGPTASFDIDDDEPEVEQWVEFDASDSEGDIEEYQWDFGDGDTYTDDDPVVSHRYNEEGEYEVELTVVDEDDQEDSTDETVYVQGVEEENEAPDVDLERPSDGQIIELPYSFRWDTSDPDGDDVESTIYISEERNDESSLDDDYLIREDVGSSESFRLSESDLDEGDYMWGVEATDEEGESTFSNVREFTVEEDEDREEEPTGDIHLDVFVEDEDGDAIRDATVVVDNENWFSQETDGDGEANFVLQSGSVEITVSKDGYRQERRDIDVEGGEDYDVTVTLERRGADDPEQARLDVHVEDDEYDSLEDAKVTVENGDDETEYTDDDGDVRFYLDSDSYDIEVECNDETEYREVYLSEGEREQIDIRFDEDFESDVCGESDNDDTDDDRDTDDSGEEGLSINDVSYPDSVCRGGSFTADMRIENRGGFHELVTITGSGLGSINTGQSFSLDIGQTKSASVRFTNVEGSGSEEFDIRATNHVSDETTESINVRDCGALPDDGGFYYSSDATGVTADFSPKETVVGGTVKVKGFVDGVRGRSQVTITANGDRKARVSTEPDGFYSTYIRLNEIGENIVRVRSGQSEASGVVDAIPTTSISSLSTPHKVFESDSFDICGQVNSQIEPQVFLVRNGVIVDSKLGNGQVCFDRQASNPGDHEFQIKALTYGKESSSITKEVEVLELGSEVTNFPNKIAAVESEHGMIKVDLYNTENTTRNYRVNLNGIRTTWLSQSQEEVILTKGERETVYFYITPEEEGNFEPTVTVVSEDTTIYSEEISVYAGGTKTPKRTSFLDRLNEFFSL